MRQAFHRQGCPMWCYGYTPLARHPCLTMTLLVMSPQAIPYQIVPEMPCIMWEGGVPDLPPQDFPEGWGAFPWPVTRRPPTDWRNNFLSPVGGVFFFFLQWGNLWVTVVTIARRVGGGEGRFPWSRFVSTALHRQWWWWSSWIDVMWRFFSLSALSLLQILLYPIHAKPELAFWSIFLLNMPMNSLPRLVVTFDWQNVHWQWGVQKTNLCNFFSGRRKTQPPGQKTDWRLCSKGSKSKMTIVSSGPFRTCLFWLSSVWFLFWGIFSVKFQPTFLCVVFLFWGIFSVKFQPLKSQSFFHEKLPVLEYPEETGRKQAQKAIVPFVESAALRFRFLRGNRSHQMWRRSFSKQQKS